MQTENAAPKGIAGSEIVGKPVSRIDGRQKVTGQATYAAEFDIPNLTHAYLVQSTIASGRILSIDTSEAASLPGVRLILTHENMTRLKPFPSPNTNAKPEEAQQQQKQNPGKPGQKLLPLQDEKIHWNGQHVAVVVADTFEQARYAASKVKIRYEKHSPVTDMEKRLGTAFHAPGDAGREPNDSKRGDAHFALDSAPVKVDELYRTPTENHNPIEHSATIAQWQGDKLTLYDATQWVSGTSGVVAAVLGIPKENVRTVSLFLGGGFGCKGSVWPHTMLAAVAARQIGRPVRLELTRQQMFTSVGYRAQTLQRVALGATRDGKLTSVIHATINQTSPYDEFTEKAGVATAILYASPNADITHKLVRMNRGTPTQMRAPGEATGTYAIESAMDELAYKLGLDPIELRLRNYAETDPHKTLPWSSKSLRQCYAQGAERFGWPKRDPRPRSMTATIDGEEWLIGLGMATATYPANRAEAAVRVQIFADGTARALSGTQDIGTGTYTIMTQLAAEHLGIPIQRVHFELGDTRLPTAPVSGGSQTAASVGSAVKVAALAARRKAIQMAIADTGSPLHGQAESQIEVGDGRLYVKSAPATGETYSDLLKRNKINVLEAENSAKPGDEKKQVSMHSFGAQFAEVAVNPVSGEARVRRFVGAFAAGHILNAKTGRSQLLGGMVWGIGMALLERSVLDPHLGRIMNADLAEYHLPVNLDVPPIEVITVDEDDPFINEIGAKGIGEIGITGAAGAIANAVYHATGRRIRDLPITPDKLL